MHGFKSLGGLLLVLLITALFLGACGESSTAAPGGSNAAISIKGTSEVTLDTSLSDFLKKNFVGAFTKDPASLPDLTIKVYSSDDDSDILAANTDAALNASGYKYNDFGNTGTSKVTLKDGSGFGLYAKAGVPDLFPTINKASQFSSTTSGTPSGVDAAAYQKFTDQFKTKKSGMFLVSASNLIQSVLKSKSAASVTTIAATTTATLTSVATSIATSTTAPTTVATTVVTTKAATTVAPTTVATTVVTTKAATTAAPATTAPVASNAAKFPVIANASEIKLDPAVESSIKDGFAAQVKGVKDLSVKFYGSSDDTETLSTSTHKALLDAGYKFAIPGFTAPTEQGDALVGFYSKPGTPDLFVIMGDPNAGLGVSGLDASLFQQISSDFATKKSVLVVLGGTGLVNALSGGSTTATTAAPAVATTTAAPAATTGGANVSTASGIGRELVGQVFDDGGGLKCTVTGVEQLVEIKGISGDALKPKGTWLVVYTNVENNTQFDRGSFFELKDAAGSSYSPDANAVLSLAFDPKYNAKRTQGGIPVGGKGMDYLVFDVPTDASGLKVGF